MMIVEAVNSAPTEHAVYFLVTAYVESLRHFERTCGVPQRVIDLPVGGFGDLSERAEALRRALSVSAESIVVTAEVAAVLNAALTRLEALAEHAPAAIGRSASHSAKSDSRHSSLSV